MQFKFKALANPKAGEADIRLYSEIGESFWGDGTSATDFAALLDDVGDVGQINLYVNSPGGSIFDAQSMVALLKRHPANVTVVVDGLMASAATFFLDVATDVVMGASSEMMIHDASSFAGGNAEDMRKIADVLDMLSGQIADIYARRAGGDPGMWRDLMKSESWFSAQEAVDIGLADRIDTTVADTIDAAALASFEFAGRQAAGQPFAVFAALGATAHKPRPVAVGSTPERPALNQKENTVTDTETQEQKGVVDGTAIDKLLELSFNAFEAKASANQEKALQKFMDAFEPAPTVPEIVDAVRADMTKRKGPSFKDVLGMIAARRLGQASAEQVDMLNKITMGSRDNVFQNAFTYGSGSTNLQEQQFIGELVAKVQYAPVIWDLIGHDDLLGPVVYGGAATTLPAGGDYAGNGAVVSSTAPVWAQEQVTASLYALAAGLARINFDFGQSAMVLNSFFRYALSDYYKWRDVKTINAILGSSTGFFGALPALTAPKPPTNSIITSTVAEIASGIVNVLIQNGGVANFALINAATDFAALMEASSQQAPAFWTIDLGALTEGEVEGKLAVRPDITGTLAAGTVVVGNGRQGITGYELADSPVRVEQVVTATGTIDTGLFGYCAAFRENANYFAKVTAVSTT